MSSEARVCSVFPEVGVLGQSPLEVLVPFEDAAGRDEGLCGVGRHLGLGHGEGSGKVVQTVQHLLSEL